MIEKLAKKIAQVIAPLVFIELVKFLETILQTDIDGDGDVGK